MNLSSPVKIVLPEGGQRLNVIGDNVVLKLTGEATGGAFTLIEQSNSVGGGIPLHVHHNEDEVFYVVDGAYEFTAQGTKTIAQAGTTVFLPRNVPHSFMVVEGNPAKALVSAFPSGIEKMFEELAALPSPADMEKVLSICATYGVHFLPPEPVTPE